MAKKSTFLEMHNAVGGSFSSNERVAELQAYGQKRQEATQKREQKISETRAAKAATAQLAEKQAQSPVRKAATLPNLNLGKNVVSETTQQLLSTAAQRGSETRQKNIPEMEQQIAALQAQKEPLDQYFSAGNSEFDNDGQLTEKAQAQRELNQQLKALQADLDAANQRETVYQRQVAKEGSSATPYQDPEFASKSAYASTKTGDGFWDRLASQWRSGVDLPVGYGDLAYEYINNQEEGLRDQIHQQQPNFGYTYDQMTDDEVALYNYYYATGGKEVADNYLKLIEDDLNQRKGAQIAQGLKGKTGSELLFGLGAGLNQFESGVEGAVNLLKGDDSYTAPSAQQYASAAVREDLADSGLNLPGWMGGASLGQAGYDLITNIANMAPSMVVNSLIPGAGTALVGATAAGNAYQEAVNQGYNASQARNYAVASGASEAALQYVLGGISNMGGKVTGHVAEKAISQIKNGVLKAAVEGGINMASEGLEEGIQEVLEPIFAKAFLGSDESVDWEQAAYSAVLGAVSAGVMNLPGTLAGSKADASTDTTIQSPQSQADVQTDVQSDIQPQQANTNMQQQTQDVQPAQGALEAPLQGEPADPRHVAAQQERTAQGQQEAVVQSPQTADVDTQATTDTAPEVTPATQQKTAMDSMLNGLLPAQQQETNQPAQTTIPDSLLANIGPKEQQSQLDADPIGQQMKGTGAAEVNFSEKPTYNAILSEDNAQADRATDVRPMELPKTDINGNPVSEVAANAYASKFTPDEFASLMEEPTARGDFSYAKITNDQATQDAIATISKSRDWETAYKDFARDVGAGKTGAEMAARGALLLNKAAQDGNKSLWLDTLMDVRSLGTNTAQGLQAMRLIRELSPPDKIEFTKMAIGKLSQKMGVDFQVDQPLYDAYNNATTDEARNAALENIQQAVADQIPSTALDKWNALRYTNMLGNLKTNVRNIAGNVGAGAMYRAKDQIAATMEDVLYKATGGKFEKTKSHTVSKELRNACKQYFEMDAGIVGDGGKYNSGKDVDSDFERAVMDKRRIFKSDNKAVNAALAPLEGYRQGTNWAMNNQYFGDEAFGRAAYTRAMAGYLKAHGVTDTGLSKVDTALIDKARAYAVREAQEATFHDNSALANVMGKLKRDTGVVGEGVMPFTKTPANVLTRAAEFSPLGAVDTAVKAVKAAKGTGDVIGTDVVNSLAKTLTGSALFALGAALRDQGYLTGGPDSDEDKDDFDSLNGDQNYALRVKIGDQWVTYTMDWLTPAAMPLFMGAQLMDILNDGVENLTFADLEKVFTSIADPMLQMSMLQSLNDSLDNIKYSDNNLAQFFINAAVSYLTQGLSNTGLGQIERSTEENRMTTYVDKDSQLPAWLQRQLGSLSQKIPGWDFQQTEYRNAWGETEENEGGLLYNLLSPGYISVEKSDALSQELYRLNEAGVEGNVFPDTPSTTVSYTDKNGDRHEDYHLTAQEADTLKEVTGKTSATLVSDLIESDMYKAMSDQQKADAVNLVYDYARELGRTEAIDGYAGMDAWMENLEDNAVKTILDKTITSSFTDAFTALSNAWEYGKDTAGAIKALDQSYALYDSMSKSEQSTFKENAAGKVGYFLNARDSGISGQTFTNLYKTYSEVNNQEDLTAAEKANKWAYSLEKATDSGQLTSSQAATLKEDMQYFTIFPAEATKFNAMTEAGMSAESAEKVVKLLDGIQGTGKNGSVRGIDKYSAIAGSSLSAKDKETAFLEYAPDVMDEKYTYAKENMGLTIDDFVNAYKVTDEYSLKVDQKAAWKAMGYTEAEAENLWQLYKGNLT